MNYSEARGHIKHGAIIGVEFNTLLGRLVKIVQRIAGIAWPAKNITHEGVAWWIGGRLYLVEMDGLHNVLRPMSQIMAKAVQILVYENPVSIDRMEATFDRATSVPIIYPYLDLLRIGLRLVANVPTGGDGDGSLVCSTFVIRWLEWAGWVRPASMPRMPSPGEGVAPFSLTLIVDGV